MTGSLPPGGQPSETVDAVIIGAGHNGLVGANLLAEAGWDVLVLEAAEQPGGAVRTAEVTAPGYRTDLGSAFYPMAAASPVLRGFELERHGLRWRHAPAALAHVQPDDRCALLSRDLEVTAGSLATFHAADGDAWREEVARWQHIRESLLRAMLGPFPPVRSGVALARKLGVADGLRLARLAVMSARALGQERFGGDGARLLLAGNALHTDVGPDSAGSAVFGWLLSMLAQDVGFPVPEGGAGELTAALVRRLTAHGGRLRCRREVTEVLTARGRAVGVRDAGGELVRARHAVLADIPAPRLYLELVDAEQLPARLLRDLRGFRWDDATVKVNWALSGTIPWNNEQAALAGTVHLDGDISELSGYSTDIACGRVPRRPFVLLGQMTTADASRSPAGTESVWAYTHVPRGLRWDGDRLLRHVERIENIIEAHAPGFTARIAGRHIQGPAGLQQQDANLVEGAINAGTAAMQQQLVFRPVPGLARADTPIDRLFLAGASAHPGGAVHGAPGANAARAALARAGLAGPAYAATIRRLHGALYRGS